MRKEIFITFEGAEGSGKSTHIRKTFRYLKQKGHSVLLVREPGSTQIGEAIRKVLLDPSKRGMSKAAELLLYLAARAQLVKEKILPALHTGKVVISDRFEDSTLAYQGFGEGIPLALIKQMSKLVRGNLKPNLTFVLDISPEIGLKRGGRYDRVERKSDTFHARVRRGFLTLSKKERRRIVVLDSRKPVLQVWENIRRELDQRLRRK